MHVAITGASSGIGEALARAFADAGHTLSLVARRLPLLEALAETTPTDARCYGVDLSDLAACTTWVDEAQAALGPIDALINNAGIQYVEPALGVNDERLQRLMAVDLLAPLQLIHRVGPEMVERGSGHIVNISSVAGIVPTPGMCHYNGAKAGLAAASESLAVELKGSGVHVMTVYPGPVTTPMEQAAREKISGTLADRAPTGTAPGLARRVLRGIERRHARVVYPRVYGLTRHFRLTSQWFTDRLTPGLAGD